MGMEIILGIAVGFMILGPHCMHSMLGTLGHAKAEFDRAKQELRGQIEAEVNQAPQGTTGQTTNAVRS